MPETAETSSEVHVFVDTNYMRAIPYPQRADWEKLLLLSRQRKIKVHISYIAREEWRSGRRDEMIAARARTVTSLRALREAGQDELLKDELMFQPPSEDLFPSIEDIEVASQSGVKKFLEKNGINVEEPTQEHQMRAWGKYFSWEPPFHIGQDHDRDNDDHRKGRKTHIPDAWIAEAALDYHAAGHRVFFLGSDGKLNSAFRNTDIASHRDVKDILSAINIAVEPSPVVPITEIEEAPATAPTPVPAPRPDDENGGIAALVTETPPQPVDGGEATEPQEDVPPHTETDVGSTLLAAAMPTTPTPDVFPPGPELAAVTLALENYDKAERGLQIRVLGYIHLTAPIDKNRLTDLVARKGHEVEHIRNTAERLTLAGFLQDTGNSYTPRDAAVCSFAAQLILTEADEALDD